MAGWLASTGLRNQLTWQSPCEAEGMIVTDEALLEAVESLRRNSVGAGPLEPLLRQSGVTDVLVNGPHQVYVDRGCGLELTSVQFEDDDGVRRLAQRLAGMVGRRLDDASPYVDARLPDGTRVHAMLSTIAAPGTCLSLRVPPRRTFSLQEMMASGTPMPRRCCAGWSKPSSPSLSAGYGIRQDRHPSCDILSWSDLTPPRHAVLLTRISDARNGDTAGVDDQGPTCCKRAAASRLGCRSGDPRERHAALQPAAR